MIFGEHDANTLEQFRVVEQRAVKAALMADAHKGYFMPIGGVAAYDNEVSVLGVGVDISCGVCGVNTNLLLSDISADRLSVDDIAANPSLIRGDVELVKLANAINTTLSFGMGRKNTSDDAPLDHPLFDDPAWSIFPETENFRNKLHTKARQQLGTIGGGNHYANVCVDVATGDIWIMTHFGSRGLGYTTEHSFLALGQGLGWADKGSEEFDALLDIRSPLGADYWALMELCGQYAYAGREWVVAKIAQIMDATIMDTVHTHHNYAWKETHQIDGEQREVIVVRKGATPAFPGQRGMIGASMGDNAVVVQGSVDPDAITQQENALFSTVHGAGRKMSRGAALGARNWKTKKMKRNADGTVARPPLVTRDMMNDYMKERGVILRGADVDESPFVYKNLDIVLASQGNTIQRLKTLKPLIVCMADERNVDWYKD